jgi:hypothetical protein
MGMMTTTVGSQTSHARRLNDELSGLFCIHEGDESEFVARWADRPPPKSKEPRW